MMCCKIHFQNRSRIYSLTTIFPAHTPDKQQPPQPGPCAVSFRLLCASLALHLLTLHSSLADPSREQSQRVLLCWYYPMTPQLTEIKSTPSNILQAHRIGHGISAEFLFLQPQLPPGSPLNTDTLLPACICPGGSSAWREPPLDLLVDIPSCSSQLYLKVTFSMRPTVHPSNTATCPVPTHLYPGSPTSEHLPACMGNTSLTY